MIQPASNLRYAPTSRWMSANTETPSSEAPSQAAPEIDPQQSLEGGSPFSSLRARTLIGSLGERQISLVQNAEGRFELRLNPPALKTVVLSGGGAKGTAFPGVLQALQQRGVLDNVDQVYGASAGAISAALLAAGIAVEDFTETTNQLDFVALMHGEIDPSAPDGYISGVSHPWLSKIPLLGDTLGKIGSNGVPLEQTVRQLARSSLASRLSQWLQQNPQSSVAKDRVLALQQRLQQGEGVTFAMLREAHQLIPQVKEFSCSVVRKDQPAQLMMFSADTTPELDIGRAARASAGLPVAFSPIEVATLFDVEGAEPVQFIDGGALLNTPSPSVIDGDGLAPPIPQPDQLIVQFESVPVDRTATGLKDKLIEQMLGLEMWASDHYMNKQLESPALRNQVLTLPLQMESKDYRSATSDFGISVEERTLLQQHAAQATLQHLDQRAAEQISVTFDTLEQCYLALDLPELQLLAQQQVEGAAATLQLRLQMDAAVDDLAAAIKRQPDRLNPNNRAIRAALDMMDKLAAGSVSALPPGSVDAARAQRQGRLDYLARRLNRAGQPELQRWLSTRLGPGRTTQTERAARELEAQVSVKTIGHRLQRELIQPALLIYKEQPGNIQLFKRIEQQVASASSRQDLGRALQQVLDEYQPSGSLLPLRSSARWVLEQAGALLAAL